ncbi:MAG: hypothetical protein AABO41_02090 [Acidobacteriota bacterium]
MRRAFVLLTLCWTLIGSAAPNSAQTPQPNSLDYRAAYERWRRAVDSYPALTEPHWVSTANVPAELRRAVADLLLIGPNLTPLLVEEMRNEKDNFRLYRLMWLLNRVSGIRLFSVGGDENTVAATPRYRDRFIEEWDSKTFLRTTELLEATWTYRDEARRSEVIDPKKLLQIRRYGVFALPFIIEGLEKRDSPELLAAFLIIIGEPELYSYYLEKPTDFLPDRAQKLEYVKSWVGKNERRIEKLEGLPQQIKALTSR